MKNRIEGEDLIREARSGNETAEKLFYTNLIVRFLPIVKCEIGRCPPLQKEIGCTEGMSREICQRAVEEIKTICPIGNEQWSLMRAIHILRNITDDFIMNMLVDLARNGNAEAENLLFTIIRKKLIQWIESKSWKAPTR